MSALGRLLTRLPFLRRWRTRRYPLGAVSRPFDPREVKYRLTDHLAAAVDVTQNRSLAAFRTHVEDQQSIGSCVANAITSALELGAKEGGMTNPPDLSRSWLYTRTRQKDNMFPGSGSVPATACDIALTGVVRESVVPYVSSETYDPPASSDADAAGQQWLAAHRPFYQSDAGGFQAGICAALAAGYPISIALGWRNEFFSPPNGILPVLPNSNIVGGHDVACWGYQYLPTGKWRAWCRNSWGTGWPGVVAADALAGAQPGDFAIPGELFANGIIWECRALVPKTVNPNPDPTPTPQNPVPALNSLTPNTVTAGSASPQQVSVVGSGFMAATTFTANGQPVNTISTSVTSVLMTLPAMLAAGSYPIVASNPTPGGGLSNALALTAKDPAPQNPVPVLSSLTPASATAGQTTLVTVTGSGFLPTVTLVFVDGVQRAAAVASATRLSFTLGSTDTVGTHTVTAQNPTPGGGASNALAVSLQPAPAPPAAWGVRRWLINADGSYRPPTDTLLNTEGDIALFLVQPCWLRAWHGAPGDYSGPWLLLTGSGDQTVTALIQHPDDAPPTWLRPFADDEEDAA